MSNSHLAMSEKLQLADVRTEIKILDYTALSLNDNLYVPSRAMEFLLFEQHQPAINRTSEQTKPQYWLRNSVHVDH